MHSTVSSRAFQLLQREFGPMCLKILSVYSHCNPSADNWKRLPFSIPFLILHSGYFMFSLYCDTLEYLEIVFSI